MDRFVETNGIRVHVLERAGDGPPLVLMPGLTGSLVDDALSLPWP